MEQGNTISISVGKRKPLPVYDEPWKQKSLKGTDHLHACTREYPGRTPYFYRKQAVNWCQHLRLFEWFKGQHNTARYFVRSYLASYREKLAEWNRIDAGEHPGFGFLGYEVAPIVPNQRYAYRPKKRAIITSDNRVTIL